MVTIAQYSDVFDRLTALGEPTRARLMLLVERQELTVSEICAVLQIPQSTASRHLKALSDAGWVASRPEGTKRFYRAERDAMSPSTRKIWLAVRDEIESSPGVGQDRARLAPVLAERRSRSARFFASEAGEWDRMRDELFGTGFFLGALPALLDPSWTVGDLGCGTGQVSASLAPFVRKVIAVDGSDAMLAEARRRLASRGNVEIRSGELEALPLGDDSLDAAVLALVLHHLPEPGKALAEVARVLGPGGRILVIDMLPHDREDLANRMGHVWLGFREETMAVWLAEAGFESMRSTALPAHTAARGPALFAATARRRRAGRRN